MLRLLAVDDSASVRASLVGYLEPLGFEVDEAENGATALRMIRAQHYDLVFLDIKMPVLDGPSRLLRAQGLTVPVVLVTSSTDRAMAGMAVRLGSHDLTFRSRSRSKVDVEGRGSGEIQWSHGPPLGTPLRSSPLGVQPAGAGLPRAAGLSRRAGGGAGGARGRRRGAGR